MQFFKKSIRNINSIKTMNKLINILDYCLKKKRKSNLLCVINTRARKFYRRL